MPPSNISSLCKGRCPEGGGIFSLEHWLTYIEGIHPKTIEMGLDRMRLVTQRLSISPTCRVVTVAGTNGKGTTVAALQTLASQQGWRVGVYTSPHLFKFQERIVLDLPDQGARPVDDDMLIAAFEAIEAAREEVSLTYFEYTTLAALWVFKRMSLDLVILEVGMGGRLDSTNIVDADIAIITRIALDHVDFLGHTREVIAAEKAGIMRRGKPCLYGGEDLQERMRALADEHGALLQCYGESFVPDVGILKASAASRIPLANLACAKQAFLLLGGREQESMWANLLKKKPAGRFTPVTFGEKIVIFDVAHNPDAMGLLAEQLKDLAYSDLRVIVGMLQDKDHEASLAALKADPRMTFYVSSPKGTPRAAKSEQLMLALKGAKAFAFDSLEDAWKASWEDSTQRTVWIVAGSFFTVAEVWACISAIPAMPSSELRPKIFDFSHQLL
ncbi:MAG: bifunctional folylpolyglutamate synthase/dihydrofolate synthase [Gammaproteobacteria bacterium]